jgi:hypothetical protein
MKVTHIFIQKNKKKIITNFQLQNVYFIYKINLEDKKQMEDEKLLVFFLLETERGRYKNIERKQVLSSLPL